MLVAFLHADYAGDSFGLLTKIMHYFMRKDYL